jgi:hypothetical protein
MFCPSLKWNSNSPLLHGLSYPDSILLKTLTTNIKNVRFEALTAVTIKNSVFWEIKTQFVLHRRHITSPLQI